MWRNQSVTIHMIKIYQIGHKNNLEVHYLIKIDILKKYYKNQIFPNIY